MSSLRAVSWWVWCVAGVALGACGEEGSSGGQAEQDAGGEVGQDAGEEPDVGEEAGGEDAAQDGSDGSDAGDVGEEVWTPDVPDFDPVPVEDGVVLTLVTLPGSQAPVNPTTGEGTPAEAGLARFVRYTLGEPEEGAQREGILVLVPGFLAGAGSFDVWARRIVTATEGRFEVWAVDRRSNGLEDLRGMNAAEAAQDPSLAHGYYFGGAQIEGVGFGGMKRKQNLSFMSEWGLEVHLEDLRAILSLVPQELRERHLFLGGHSLGASVVQAYAAFEFRDGHKGHDDLAGLMVVDGTVRVGGEVPDEEAYLTGFDGGFMGRVQGLTPLRDGGNVLSGLPLVSADIFLTVEVAALRASKHTGNPYGYTPDPKVDAFFQLVVQAKPRANHEAALGFAFDQQFQPLAFLNANMGNAGGGRLTPYRSLFDPDVTLLRPDDPSAFYTWEAYDAVDPKEVTDLQSVALAMYVGPSNFVEWYFPSRLPLDLALLGGLAPITAEDWRWGYGIRTSAAGEVDAPALAIGGEKGLVASEEVFEVWKNTLAPTTRHGHSREEAQGYRAIIAPRHGHLDVVMSDDEVEGGNGITGPLLEWMEAITEGQTFAAPAL